MKWFWDIESMEDLTYCGDLERFAAYWEALERKRSHWMKYTRKPASDICTRVGHLYNKCSKQMENGKAPCLLLVGNASKVLQAIARFTAVTLAINYPMSPKGFVGEYTALNGKYARLAEVKTGWLVDVYGGAGQEFNPAGGDRSVVAIENRFAQGILIWHRLDEGSGHFQGQSSSLMSLLHRRSADRLATIFTYAAGTPDKFEPVAKAIEKWYGYSMREWLEGNAEIVILEAKRKYKIERI